MNGCFFCQMQNAFLSNAKSYEGLLVYLCARILINHRYELDSLIVRRII